MHFIILAATVHGLQDTLQQAVSAAAAPALFLSNESSICPLWMLQ